MANPTTPWRGYQKPDPTNLLSQDVLRLVTALDSIDLDVYNLITGLAQLSALAVKLSGNQSIQGVKTFEETPLLPDLPISENSAKAVNAKFVKSAIAALVDTAPGTLDTLNELAAALGDDPNFSATMVTALAGKAPLAHNHAIADVSGLGGALAAILPPGMGPFPWSRTQLPAGGWTWADGSILLPSTQFIDLRAAYIADGFPWGQDGSGNPLLPDMRGRVPAGRDDMGGTAAGRLSTTLTGTRASTANGIITGLSSTSGLCVGMSAFGTGVGAGAVIVTIDSATQVTLSPANTATGSGSIRFSVIDGNTLGAAGGTQVHKLTIEQIPSHTHTLASRADRNTASGGSDNVPVQSAGNSGFTSNARGGDQAHPNMQPTMVVNYIVKT